MRPMRISRTKAPFKPPKLVKTAMIITMCLAFVVLVHAWKQQLLSQNLGAPGPTSPAQRRPQKHAAANQGTSSVCPKAASSMPAHPGLVLKGVEQQCTGQAPRPPRDVPFVCAHGGASQLHPPNTAAAYAAALSIGADCIEVDASLTADLHLVACHDRDLQRLLGQPAAQVRDMTLQQLQALTWPSGERLLTVAEALQQVQEQVELLIVDVKASAAPDEVLLEHDGRQLTETAALLQALRQLPLRTNSLVWAKSDEIVQQAQEAGLGGLTGYVVMRAPGNKYESPLRLKHSQVAAVYHAMLDASLAATLRAHDKQVFVWTPDEAGDLRRVLDLGVDGIVTNAPQAVLSLLAERDATCPSRMAEL